jgi:hypothetical protein
MQQAAMRGISCKGIFQSEAITEDKNKGSDDDDDDDDFVSSLS